MSFLSSQARQANALHLKEVEALQQALNQYVSDLQGAKVEGQPSRKSDWSAVAFLERLQFAFPSVMAEEELDQYCSELGINSEGYVLSRADGEPLEMPRMHIPAVQIEG